jgi:Nucleotide modification associated domain 2
MRVGRIITFDEYWSDPNFAAKKPVLNGSRAQQYGDNIYHRDPLTLGWIQEDSFHSREGGVTDEDNLNTDTGHTDRVLIADWFVYWGGDGPAIPPELSYAVQKTQGHKMLKEKLQIEPVVNWAKSVSVIPIIGDPTEWRFLKGHQPIRCYC